MSDLSGQVTHLEWSVTPLWWIPLLPFLGGGVAGVGPLGLIVRLNVTE